MVVAVYFTAKIGKLLDKWEIEETFFCKTVFSGMWHVGGSQGGGAIYFDNNKTVHFCRWQCCFLNRRHTQTNIQTCFLFRNKAAVRNGSDSGTGISESPAFPQTGTMQKSHPQKT